MKKLSVISCYFGRWPEWADLFIETCRSNPTVDFLLVSDCAAPRQGFPANVRWVHLEFPRFAALASERLGFDIALPKPYKLIDFKPAWGVIFQEYLGEADFWGFCDLDILLGDIRGFLTDELLERYDVISCRREFLSGHFLLFRNTEAINRLYEQSRDYRRIFTSDSVHNFDECGHGLHPKLLRGATFAEVAGEAKIDSMMHVLARSPEISVHYETICGEQLYLMLGGNADKKLKILVQDGKVLDLVAGQERMYFHLQFLKVERRVFVPRWKEIPRAFLLTRRGVFWIGEQPLGQRLASSLHRAYYFFLARPVLMAPLLLKWQVQKLLRALYRLKRTVLRPAGAR